ncbi:MAG TPA: hypothetical protein VL284_05080 [Thermoanaerobaculia bacterium]|nr:hypothetical protein [Thermoanaerobaculia bacterium]
MNPQVIMFAIGIAVVVIIAIALAVAARRSKTQQLREHFGTEYDRTVRQAGSRTAAEDQLIARAEEAKAFEIRALTPAERDRFAADWKAIETHFVERPTTAVVEADELITSVMRTRGYPMADFERYAELLSVKHPRVVEHYRAGHGIIDRHGRGAASTEDLRQAMLHYRALFEDLAGTTTDVARPVSTVREVTREEERPR